MTKKILIVEDDKMLRTIFEMFIKEIGYELHGFANTGDEAVTACQAALPDAILMDIHLDGEKDGIETAKIIEDRFDLPVIYISGDSQPETIKKSILSNTYGYMLKPIYKQNLEAIIEFACEKHKFNKRLQK